MPLLPPGTRQPLFPPRPRLLLWSTPKHLAQPGFGEKAYIALAANTDQMVIFPFLWATVKLGVFSSFLLSPLTLWLGEGPQTVARKGQHPLGGERNQELIVNKRTKEQICCGWKASVFLLSLSNHKWENPSHSSHLFISTLLSQMFDMMALTNEGVCEWILKPTFILLSYQQGCSRSIAVRRVQQDVPAAVTLSSPYRAERAKFCTTASPCGKEVVFQFCLHWHNHGLPGEDRNIYQNKESNYAKVRELLGGLFFFWKESSARPVHGLKEQGGVWVAENRSHFYPSSEGSSNFLPFSRVCCRLHRHSSGFDHRKEGSLSFNQASPYPLPVTVQTEIHRPSWCWTPTVLVRWDLGSC